jgi:acyl carrier protein
MNQEKVYEVIKEFCSEKLHTEALETDTPLRDYGEFDSLLVVELILFLEEALNIEIPEEYYGMENFETIAKIINTVEHSESIKSMEVS